MPTIPFAAIQTSISVVLFRRPLSPAPSPLPRASSTRTLKSCPSAFLPPPMSPDPICPPFFPARNQRAPPFLSPLPSEIGLSASPSPPPTPYSLEATSLKVISPPTHAFWEPLANPGHPAPSSPTSSSPTSLSANSKSPAPSSPCSPTTTTTPLLACAEPPKFHNTPCRPSSRGRRKTPTSP